MQLKKIVLFIFTFAFSISYSQSKSELTAALEKLYQQSDFPGFTVAIVNENGIVYQNAFGYADIQNKKPYTIASVQNIGSISKTFIGIALMKAIELGYFDLDTAVNDILPFQVINPNAQNETIQIRHLATHTSGILDDEKIYGKTFLLNKYSDTSSPLYTKFKKEATIPDRDDVSLADFLKNYLAINGKWYKKTNFNASAVGLTYNYTNIGAALAAYLIEIKSNLPFDTFCATYIFEPLQLKATRWKLDATTVPKHVQIYNTKKEPYPLYSAITYPDGNLKTSCEDLSQYLISMIKGYKGNGNLLSKASFATLFKKQFSDNQLPQGYDKKEPNSGIFWRIKSNGQIGHTGSDVGVTTFLFFNPETGFGKLFMTNIEFDGPNDNANKKLIQQFIAVWKKLEEYEK